MKKIPIARRYCAVLIALLTLGCFQTVNAGPGDPLQGVIISLQTPKGHKNRARPPAHQALALNVSGHLQVESTRPLTKRAWRQMLDRRFPWPGKRIGLEQTPLPLQLKMRPLYPPTRPLPSGSGAFKAPASAPTPRAVPAGPSSPR